MRPRGDIDFGAVLVIAVLALAVYGGYALATRKSDDCFWIGKESSARGCLFDIAPTDGCFSDNESAVLCGDMENLAAFSQKAGRRICGRMAGHCSDGGQH